MKLFIKHAKTKATVIRSIKVALIVGTILGIINHFDAISSGHISLNCIIQILVTYLVPYSVATYGAASNARQMELQQL